MEIRLTSPAKINLTLDIMGIDHRSGRHFVNTVLYRDDQLFDEILLERHAGDGNLLLCEHTEVPMDSTNTILRALSLLEMSGWKITLKKKIPPRSGLGGGSSNAGVILKYFGEQRQTPQEILLRMAREIGTDVPFFLLDENVAYFEGFGDQLMQNWRIDPLSITYVDSGFRIASKDAYESLDLESCGRNSAKTEALLKALSAHGEILRLTKLFHNDFEEGFFHANPDLREKGRLCGSGGFLFHLAS